MLSLSFHVVLCALGLGGGFGVKLVGGVVSGPAHLTGPLLLQQGLY